MAAGFMLCLLMVFAGLMLESSLSALASAGYGIKLGNTEVTDENIKTLLDNGAADDVNADGTVTLSGSVTFSCSLTVPENLTLRNEGT